MRCVDEAPAAEVDADVALAVEEDEVARRELAAQDVAAGVPLAVGDARQADAEPAVDEVDEARAVEAGRRAAAPPVGHAQVVARQQRRAGADARRRRRGVVVRRRRTWLPLLCGYCVTGPLRSDVQRGSGVRPDLAVDQQAVASLERAHGAHGDRAVVAVGRDAERALDDGDGGAAVVQAQDDRARRATWCDARRWCVRPCGRAAVRVLRHRAAQPDVQCGQRCVARPGRRPAGRGVPGTARTARTVTGP